MNQLVELPSVLVLLQTAAALAVFCFLPAYLYFYADLKKRRFGGFASLAEGIETVAVSVFFSLVLLALVGMVLAFSIGVGVFSLLAVYAIVFGALVWTKKAL